MWSNNQLGLPQVYIIRNTTFLAPYIYIYIFFIFLSFFHIFTLHFLVQPTGSQLQWEPQLQPSRSTVTTSIIQRKKKLGPHFVHYFVDRSPIVHPHEVIGQQLLLHQINSMYVSQCSSTNYAQRWVHICFVSFIRTGQLAQSAQLIYMACLSSLIID